MGVRVEVGRATCVPGLPTFLLASSGVTFACSVPLPAACPPLSSCHPSPSPHNGASIANAWDTPLAHTNLPTNYQTEHRVPSNCEQALAKNAWDTPLAHTHFKAEGDVEFKAVMFIPTYAPPGGC